MAREKPVIECTVKEIDDFEYYATCYFRGNPVFFASNSLINLKAFIRNETRFNLAWISTNVGSLSYGQSVCSTIPYSPRR